MAPPTPNGQNGSTPVGVGEKAGSPVKEHVFLHRETSLNRETSASDFENEAQQAQENVQAAQANAS